MKKFIDTQNSALIGLLGGVLVLATMAMASHQDLLGLFNLPGLVMVLGGTLAATLVSRPMKDVITALRALRALLRDENPGLTGEIGHLLNIAHWYRDGNLRAAEQAIEQVSNPLLRAGAQLVIDREPIQDIVKLLQWRVIGARTRDLNNAQILRTMAMFAPAFGMLGTLFGLIQMLAILGASGLSEIGATMSFALITTLYGLLLANMVFKPLAMKMEQRIEHQTMLMNFIIEGILLLHDRRHPTVIKEALTTYMQQHHTAAPDAIVKAA
ncbi:MAG: chemotaxis protein MotA [Gammaproteobacteria bacterium]|nr:MAG: chemotaxis protein MotA [Gammaproteobacteria bacterium]TND02613.1 MAG: chemotaxis protein MotA [Gammaproteobacteria bacterium]